MVPKPPVPKPPDLAPADPVEQAAGAILARLDKLSEAVSQSVWDGVPGYSSVLLDRADLEGFVRANVLTVFTSLRDGGLVGNEALRTARRLGESRALQGVPVEALVRSFRAAERAMVEHFTRFYGLFAKDFAGQRAGVSRILEVLDRVEAATLDSYRDTQLRLLFHGGLAVGDLVGKLASGEEVSSDDLRRLAAHLHVIPTQPHLAVAAWVIHDEDRHALGQIRHHLTARLLEVAQRPVLTGMAHETMIFLVPVVETGKHVVRQAIERALLPTHCRYDVLAGIGAPAPELAAVGESCRQAMDALETGLRVGRVREALDYDDVLVDVLLTRDLPVAERLVSLALNPIEGQEHLLSTLVAYFAADQSTPKTARVLVVHQNTVGYRLRRIRELTGLDVHVTDDLVLLRLAMRARGLGKGSDPAH